MTPDRTASEDELVPRRTSPAKPRPEGRLAERRAAYPPPSPPAPTFRAWLDAAPAGPARAGR